MVVELAGSLPAAHDPDVLPVRRGHHLPVHRPEVPSNEAESAPGTQEASGV